MKKWFGQLLVKTQFKFSKSITLQYPIAMRFIMAIGLNQEETKTAKYGMILFSGTILQPENNK